MDSITNKMGQGDKSIDDLIRQISVDESKYQDYEYPKVSIVIPTYNSAKDVRASLESLLEQEYPDYEILVIDGGSTDRTLEVIKAMRDERVHIYSVSSQQRYEMLNKGISQASGAYINFLFPGDFYIYRDTLKHMMSLALENNKPHIVYCGSLLRDGKSEVKILYRPFNLKLLQQGQQPTSLQSIWFRADTFREIGKFRTVYELRGGYELLCRFALNRDLRAVGTHRVLTDYDLRWVTKTMVFRHFVETLRIILIYFGFIDAARWLCNQKDGKRFFKLWYRNLRVAFMGK